MGPVCVRLYVGSAHAPPNKNWVPRELHQGRRVAVDGAWLGPVERRCSCPPCRPRLASGCCRVPRRTTELPRTTRRSHALAADQHLSPIGGRIRPASHRLLARECANVRGQDLVLATSRKDQFSSARGVIDGDFGRKMPLAAENAGGNCAKINTDGTVLPSISRKGLGRTARRKVLK